MTHLMARGGPPGRRDPQRDAIASGPGAFGDRNAPGGPASKPGQMSHYQRSLV